jgi:hypothetical protein
LGIIDNAKEVADLIKKIGDQELYRRIVDLQGEVVELSGRVVTLSQLLLTSEQKIAELDALLNIRGKMQRLGSFYFLVDDPDGHCPKCWEVDHRMVHVVSMRHDKMGIQWTCPQCRTAYRGSPKREHQHAPPPSEG